MNRSYIYEVPIDTLVGKIDIKPNYVYRLNPSTTNLFNFNDKNGEITVKNKIDRESLKFNLKKDNWIRLIIVTQPSSLITINIQIKDLDDNKPSFNEKDKTIYILENTPIDTKIILPQAVDLDDGDNGKITKYWIENIDNNNEKIPFDILKSEESDDDDMLYLVVKGLLDREKQSMYKFNIVANGSYKNEIIETQLSLSIHITDVNDNAPIFENTNYTIILTSENKKNDIIGKVLATDEDEGENGKIIYKLNSNSFSINEKNGEIKLLKDKVNCSSNCILIIEASDNGTEPLRSRAFVTVKSFEENLFTPEISFRLYPAGIEFANVLENATIGNTVAVLTIKDSDKGDNGETDLEIINGNEKNYFYLEKGKNFGILRVNDEWINYSKKKKKFNKNEYFKLTFEASDKGTPKKSSKKSLKIFVRPSEDIPPTLSQSIIKTKIDEWMEVGTFVTRIFVETKNDKLEFSMIGNEKNDSEYFYLNKESGYIFLKKKLNVTKRSQFTIDVSVKKEAPYITSSVCRIDITVIPSNNPPIFDKDIWEFKIPQKVHSTKDFLIGRVKAIDNDKENNGKITYKIVDPLKIYSKIFRIKEKTGDIYFIENNDYKRNKEKYIFQVMAIDKGINPKTSFTNVIVLLDKKSHLQPYFPIINNYQVIRLHEFPDTVLLHVTASIDNNKDGRKLTYYLIDNEYNDFIKLDYLTGEIKLRKKVSEQFKIGDVFVIEIGVKDLNDNKANENAKVTFEIVNDNQNLDIFSLNNKFHYEIDDDKKNITIGKINIIEGIHVNEYNGFELLNCNNILNINKETGELKIEKNIIINRENHICIVKLGKASKKLFLTFKKKNDIYDKVIDNLNDITINVDHKIIGQEIFSIPFIDLNCNYIYSIDTVLLEINEKTGVIRLSNKITDVINQIQATITISDPKRSLKVLKTFKINIIFTNKRKKEKSIRTIQFEIEENVPIGYIIGNIKKESIIDNNSWYFYNNSFTRQQKISILSNGSIVVSGYIDREEISYVKETFTNGIEVVNVFVDIEDINDNVPTCESNQKFFISQNLETFSTVGLIKCNDSDFGKNSILSYKLLSHHEIFYLDNKRGILNNLKKINTDQNNIIIEVTDSGGLKTKTNISVIVLNENTKKIVFEKNYYYWDLNIVDNIKVKANGNVTYKLYNYEDYFEISKSGRIRVRNNALLVPSITYNLTVIGTTKLLDKINGIGFTFVLIDPPKPIKLKPIFTKFDSYIKLDDTTIPGSIITTVGASIFDPKTPTIALDNILYTLGIEGNYNGTFEIDLYSGEIILSKYLTTNEREYLLKVKAVAGNGMISEKEMTIIIEKGYKKENNEFELKNDIFYVTENNVRNLVVGKIKFINDELNDFNDIKVEILFDTTLNNYFEIQNDNLIIKNSIDREEYEEVYLLLQITQKNNSYRKWITIKIIDTNDNYPECSGINAVVIKKLPLTVQLPCIDLDYSINGSLGYSLHNSKEMKKFNDILTIDPNGNLLIKKEFTKIDIKDKPSYITLNIFDRAYDERNGIILNDSLRKSIQRHVVLIKWNEIEDFTFESKSYNFFINENTDVGDVIGRVIPTKDSFIFIIDQIIDGTFIGNKNFFDVDDKGNLKITRKLNSEMKIIKLILLAIGRNGETTETEVIINVNTNKYIFNFQKNTLPSIVNLSIEDNEVVEKQVIEKISKILPFKNLNNLMSFTFDSKYNEIENIFEINKNTGIISWKILNNITLTNIYYGVVKISLCNTNDIEYFIPISINIEKKDSKKPKILSCIEDQRYFIREDAPLDSIIGSVITQQNNGLIYELINSPSNIMIESSTGIIRVSGPFDHEKEAFYKFSIKVTNTLNFSSTCDSYLYIEDINDNKPQILNRELEIYIDENAKIGDKIFTFDIYDEDADSYFNYKLSPESNPYGIFSINDIDGTIQLEKELDYEKEKKHELEVTVMDNIFPNIVNYIKTTVTVIVNDINDNSPIFETDTSTFFISKDKKKDDLIGIINAIDPDKDYGGIVHYRIIPETLPQYEVYIDNVFGYLYLNTNNITTDEVNFIVEAYDNGEPMLKTTHEVKLIKEKEFTIDDNEKEIFKISIKENLPIGSFLIRFEKDTNIIGYSSSPMCRYISSSRIVLLNNYVDYEVLKNFTCTIKSINDIMLGQILVLVEDVNDNIPIFYEKIKEIYISEGIKNLPISIGEMTAYDNDENLNSLIQYSLIDGPSNYFSINTTSGVIFLNEPLDREKGSKYILTIEAFDSGSNVNHNYGTLIINVVDINDNPPNFDKPLYYIKVEENTKSIDNLIKVTAKDVDEGDNGYIIYRLENNENDFTINFPFSINSKTGQISLLRSLDYEDKNLWNFSVVAEDNGKFNYFITSVPVIVEVKNTEDRIGPTIRNTLFDVYIKENTKRDSIVFVIDAVEKVAPNLYKSDTLKYTITELDSKYFYVDENGVIYLKDTLEEGKNNYDVGVIVTDGAGNNATTKLSIYIATQSKFPKLLPLLKSRVALKEDIKDIDILKIEATNNGNEDNIIKYFIASGDSNGDFYIDPLTGVLSVKNLNRENFPGYNLIIGVSLSNYIAYTSYQRIQVHVIDVNEPPKFILPIYEIKIEENEIVPKKLLTVQGIDNDSNDFNQIEYKIIDGNEEEKFIINSKNGEITLNQILDAEEKNKYILTVEGKDNGNLSSTTKVLIIVKDQNDNSPKFTKLFSPEIYENNIIGEIILTITSIDLDIDIENRNNLYFLENNYNDTFNLDSETGELKVMKKLDREEISEYKLRVTAKDDFWQISTTFFVTVKDKNDNKPQFEKDFINIKLSGNEKYGDILGVVKATDKDEGKNAKIVYKLEDPTTEIFYIEPLTGQIIFLSHSNILEIQKTIRIIALDMGDTPNSAFIDIIIQNEVNKNEILPIENHLITQNTDQVTISVWENIDFNSKLFEFDKKYIIISITCPKNKKNIFNDLCEKENLFEIKNQTLYLFGKLDYETESLYTIKLQSGDKIKILNIKVLDVNEYFPVIVNNEIPNSINQISKYSKSNTILSFIEAMDLDLGKGSDFNFYMNSSTQQSINEMIIDRKIGLITLKHKNNLSMINEHDLFLDVIVKNGKLDRKTPKHDIVRLIFANTTPPPIFDKAFYTIDLPINEIGMKTKLIEFNFVNNNNGNYIYSIYSENKNEEGLICIDNKEGFITICNNITTNSLNKFKPKKYKYILTILENSEKKNNTTILRSKAVLIVKLIKKIDGIPKLLTYTVEGTKENSNIVSLNIKKNEKVEIDDSNLKELFTINTIQKVLMNKKVIKRRSPNVDYINIPLKFINNIGKVRKETIILGIEKIKKVENKKISFKNIIIQGVPNFIDVNINENCKIPFGKFLKLNNLTVHHGNTIYKIIESSYNDYPNDGVWLEIDTSLQSGVGEILYQMQNKFNDMTIRFVGIKKSNDMKVLKKQIFISIMNTFNKVINSQEGKKIVEKFINNYYLEDKVRIINNEICHEICNKVVCGVKIIPSKDFIEYSYNSYTWYGPVIDIKYNCVDDKVPDNSITKKCSKRPFYISQIFGQNYYSSQFSDCQNGGFCDPKLEVCSCSKGFKGVFCEEDINECLSDKNICGDEGVCINLPGSYKCICENGIERFNCNNNKTIYNKTNTCNGSICKNGLCIPKEDSPDSWYCSCNKGYYGKNCETKIYSFEYSSFIEVDIKNEEIEELIFDFNTKQENGILFYSYNLENQYDYITVDLINGNLRLSLNRSITNELINEFFHTPINDGIWKRLQLIFTHNSLIINLKACNDKGTECLDCNNDICRKEIETIYGKFTLPSKKFLLGGIGNDDKILNRGSQINSPEFVGCMKDIYLNGLPIYDYNVIVDNLIDHCSLIQKQNNCQENICGKFGKCFNEINGYSCKCNDIFNSDSSCKDIIQPVSLGDGQVAFELTVNGKKLLQFVSNNRSGIENLPNFPKKNIQRRRISGNTFSEIFTYTSDNILSSIHYSKISLQNQKLEIDFKTNHTDGVLLSIYSINSSKIFMLKLENGTLNYCVYDGLTNIFTIKISDDISNLHWHRIGIITSINNPNTITFKLNGEVFIKNLDNIFIPIFVHKDLSAILVGAAKSTSFIPFKGCVRRLIINDYGYSMISNLKKAKVNSLFSLKHLGQVEIGCSVPPINENECDDCEDNFYERNKKLNDLGDVLGIAFLFLLILIILSLTYFFVNKHQWKKNEKKKFRRKRQNEINENNIFPNLDNIPRTFVSYQNSAISAFSSYENINTNPFTILNNGNINPGFSSNTQISNTIDLSGSGGNPSTHNLSHIYDAPVINATSIIQNNIFTKDYYQNPTLEMDETGNNIGTEKRCRKLVTFSPTNGISYISDNNYHYPSTYYINNSDDDGKESPYL
uniref:Cadherin domain-containing protein n=1 Tax=Strongyloides stercoralis TaxID=6248 RepID=A0AAF5I088_STRER